jgi:chitin disaccharide deacetylase
LGLFVCGALMAAPSTRALAQVDTSRRVGSSAPAFLLVRSDDGGMSHSVNSEWKGLRWGPIAGASAVPSLVDADGLFFSASEALQRNHPDAREVERELRAQLGRARRSGLRIDYVDYHMGTVTRYPELREIAERRAREYGLGMAQYFGETREDPQYVAAPSSKGDSLTALVGRLQGGVTLLVTHVGLDDAELGALVDMNPTAGWPR